MIGTLIASIGLRKARPKATEAISYQMPTFKLNGKNRLIAIASEVFISLVSQLVQEYYDEDSCQQDGSQDYEANSSKSNFHKRIVYKNLL